MESFSWKSFIAGFVSATAIFLVVWNFVDFKPGGENTDTLSALPSADESVSSETSLSLPSLDDSPGVTPTKPKKFSMRESDLPLAPVFSSTMPRKFQTDKSGVVRLSWRIAPGARGYVVSLEQPDGTPVKTYPTSNNYYFLKLAHGASGAYRIRIRGVSASRAQGPFSEARELVAGAGAGAENTKPVTTTTARKIENPARVPAAVAPAAPLKPAVTKPAAHKPHVKLAVPAIKEIKVEE